MDLMHSAEHRDSSPRLKEREAKAAKDAEHDDEPPLQELLNETKILLPGTEVFLGFLATMPFTEHFHTLPHATRIVFICTFGSTLLSLILFVVPAAYHRIARPIQHKERFKCFANRFLVAGLVPMSVTMVLATYLVTSMVVAGAAIYMAAAIAVLILAIWWAVPLLLAHDRIRHVPN